MTNRPDLNRRQLMAATAMLAASASMASAHETPAKTAMPDLTGKSILITGCSTGFGRLGAEHYARLGAKVFATMRNLPRPEAEELRALADTDDLDITVIEIDILSDNQVSKGVKKALASTGGTLDVLINNAGIAVSGPAEVQDMQATKLAFDTNVFGAHRMTRAALPAMRKAKAGHIINITSVLGRLVIPGGGHYCATKFALEAMSEQLAYELVPRGIDVTIIEPGGYPTKIWESGSGYSTELKERTDAERLEGNPELAARMVREGGLPESDSMDVPHAIAEIIAMPAGQRPLRRPVHPTAPPPQLAMNAASKKMQLAYLGDSPLGPWVKAALD